MKYNAQRKVREVLAKKDANVSSQLLTLEGAEAAPEMARPKLKRKVLKMYDADGMNRTRVRTKRPAEWS